MNFVAVAILSSIFLATRSTKKSTFEWFESRSPFFNSGQIIKTGFNQIEKFNRRLSN